MADVVAPATPAVDSNTVPIYDISGPEPVLGNIAHEEVQDALASGKYSLPQGHQVHVVDPDGQLGTIDAAEAPEALQNGYQYATPKMQREIKYSGAGQGAKAFLEGAGEGVAGPLAPLAEKALGVKEEDIRGRREERGGMHGLGQAVGLGAGLLTGTGEAAVMTKAGDLAAEASGFGHVLEASKLAEKAAKAQAAIKTGKLTSEGIMQAEALIAKAAEASKNVSYAAKVGSEAVKQAAEMAVLQGPDEVAKQVLHDPDASAQSAIANIGLSAAIGGAGGALIQGAVAPLWKATAGPKLEAVLGALKTRLNGESESTLLQEAKSLGVNIPPEIEGAMSEDPMLRAQASNLRQSDTNKAARAFQETEGVFRDNVNDEIVKSLGKTPGELGSVEMSEAEHGKSLGESLVKEYKSKIDPIIQDLEETKGKFGSAELDKDVVTKVQDTSNPYQTVTKEVITPGTATQIADKISQKAIDEGWLADRLSPEARMIRTTIKELRSKNTLDELVKLGQNIGNSTKSTLPFGQQTPLSRAGTIVRGLIRDGENATILAKVAKDAPELLEKYRTALENFKEVAQLKDALNDRLKVNGSVSGFAKGLAEMAKTDSETLLNRIKGTKDAHLLQFLQENFPETAEKLKQYHKDALLRKAMMLGKDGEGQVISPTKLIKGLNETMSPELRNFAVGQETASKITRLNDLLTKLNDSRHNFSNTARTVDKILQHGPSSALSMAAFLSGHGYVGAIAPIAEMVSREAGGATRLAMLRFLGSSQPVKAEGFKAMVDFLHNTYKGENLLSKASKALFKAGAQVVPSHLMPDDKDRAKLDKAVAAVQENPKKLEHGLDSDVGHYLPEHQTALAQTSATAVRYLSNLKPQPYKPGPLDKEIQPSTQQIARYNRALNIAQQPAIVLQHIKDGTLQSTDIQDLQNMYPALYKTMAQKMSNDMISHKSEDGVIPYKTRMGISLFLGQPMDVSMQPSSIQAAQPKPRQQPQQGGMAPKKSTAPLNKGPKAYQTPGQAAESDRSGRD